METLTQTERLIIRLPRPDDARDSFEIYSDPEVCRYIDGFEPFCRVEEAELSIMRGIDYNRAHGVCHWVVEEKETGRMVGHCGFNLYDNGIDLELVVHLKKDFWGRGYATEGVRACVAYARGQYPQKEIFALAMTGNVASQRVLDKCGFRFMRSRIENDVELLEYGL